MINFYPYPNNPFYDPNHPFYDPNQAFYDPNQAFYDPNQFFYDPNQPFYDPNQPFYDPTVVMYPSGFVPGNQMSTNQPVPINKPKKQKKGGPSILSRIPSLHLPAIILFAFSWLLHAIATFIPYWSIYSGISGSRAGFILN
jgi:hypothetical protein